MGTLTYSPLAGGWLSGRRRKGSASSPTSSARPPARFDMSTPANQRKLDAVEELALLAEQSDLPLIEMAVAFVINHPGVTSAIIGPRTMEQLEAFLPAVNTTLATDVLDRIDEIVAPGLPSTPTTTVTATKNSNRVSGAELDAQRSRRGRGIPGQPAPVMVNGR